jgi:hypothetical protein
MLLILLLCVELASLVDFGAWFDLPWFQGEYDFFAIEKPCVVVAALLSLELSVGHPHGLF